MSGRKTVALVVASGVGERAGAGLPKQYARIGGKALLAHAVDRLAHPAIDEVRVVIGAGHEALYAEAVGFRPLPAPTVGGATRRRSVLNGLEVLTNQDVERVLIHDAARPFLPARVIDALLDALDTHDGAVPVLPVVDTLVRAGNGDPVDRDRLVRVQTPQAFRFDAILAAHRAWEGNATDDAQIAHAAGLTVAQVPGDSMLDKITYSEDFARAEAALGARLETRTGMGFDVHAFAVGEELWLGGVRIPHSHGLSGHSDADVLLHAVTDALLGAIGDGDIGTHFPPSDPQWRGAASARFAEHALSLIEARGGRIVHVDATIVCEAPRIGPHRDAIRASLAAILRLPVSRVSLKATTTERLGFTGRGEGMAAQAVATIRLPEE